ncbi:MAG: adenosylcobinamide-GDP ribazoletransferase [Nitrospiraceae bacterium]|nr:MAG: adenosylcobinamide-GDP ribazoletransferase [Nitrospiraceae bacterium]
MIKQMLIAFQFLTLIPVKKNLSANEDDVAKSASFFVLVGLLQGILLVLTEYLSGIFFHQELVIGLVLLVLVMSNGGFHLDGLADTFDAIAVKSSGDSVRDKEKRLSVIKDSLTGPAGVTAIVFTLLLKYAALKNLTHFLPFTYYSSLLLMPVFSKWTMVVTMVHGKAARENGLGKIFTDKTGVKEIAISTILLVLILILIQALASRYVLDNQHIFYAILFTALYFFCRISVYFFNKKFGGITGDTLGATSELTEVFFLLAVIIWSRLSI